MFCHSVNILISVIIVNNEYQVIGWNNQPSQGHLRYKRLYEGTEASDDPSQSVVFLKTAIKNINNSGNECFERMCTGTLIHKRFVLTANRCINDVSDPSLIKIFLKTRPYDEIKENMAYNVGQKIERVVKPTDSYDDVALILMNTTFPDVKLLPFLPFPLLANGFVLACSTIGFSFVGRNLSLSKTELVKPMTYELSVTFDPDLCARSDYRAAYLCLAPNSTDGPSLCSGFTGDEGAPLLCPRHQAIENQTGSLGPSKNSDQLYVYGIAVAMPGPVQCNKKKKSNSLLFLFMLRYGVWIQECLLDFDIAENETLMKNYVETTTIEDDMYFSTTLNYSTTTYLPENYDDSDYKLMRKEAKRCKNRHVKRSSWTTYSSTVVTSPLQFWLLICVFWSLWTLAVAIPRLFVQ